MVKRIKDPFGASFPDGFEVSPEHEVVDPHPEPPPPAPAPAGYHSPAGLAYVRAHWQWKLSAPCPRCGGPRFMNIYDVGAGYGPPGCQIGICSACGTDLKLGRRRKRLATWKGA